MSASWSGNLFRKKTATDVPVPEKERMRELKAFSKAFSIPLADGRSLDEALTHKSYAHERLGATVLPHNEKLEFLGDSVLGIVVCYYLYAHFPGVDEGGLSKIKSVVVSATSLSDKAQRIGLGAYLRLGKGEAKSGGRERPALLADALEAVIGAVYLNGGLPSARSFVLSLMEGDLVGAKDGKLARDYKTLLQEYFQRVEKKAPHYLVLREWGPDHNRSFEVECQLGGRLLSKGTGKSKKEAEQAAAQRTALDLNLLPDPGLKPTDGN